MNYLRDNALWQLLHHPLQDHSAGGRWHTAATGFGGPPWPSLPPWKARPSRLLCAEGPGGGPLELSVLTLESGCRAVEK